MNNITLLDGSIGQELVNRSSGNPDGLWSTRTLIDHPDLVRAVHDGPNRWITWPNRRFLPT